MLVDPLVVSVAVAPWKRLTVRMHRIRTSRDTPTDRHQLRSADTASQLATHLAWYHQHDVDAAAQLIP